MRCVLVAAWAVGLFTVPGSASAQTAAGPLQEVVGQRVRIWTPDGRRLEGTLLESAGSAATLDLRDERGVAARESVEVARVQRYGGQRRRIREGVLWGTAGGAVLGGALSTLGGGGGSGGGSGGSSTFGGVAGGFSVDPWIVTGTFAAIGASFGLLIGASHRADVWRDLDPPAGGRATLRVSRDGRVQVGARVRFR